MTLEHLNYRRTALDRLPEDVLLCVLCYLNIASISSLSRTCRILHAIVEDSGWKIYAIEHPLPSQSLTPALECDRWSMRDLVRHQKLAKSAWERRQFVSRPLGPEWSSKLHPVMASSSSRLVVAAGNALFCYKFTPPTSQHSEAPRVVFERVMAFPKDARRDITGVAFEPDGQGLILSFFHGALGRISLPQSVSSNRKHLSVTNSDVSSFQSQEHPIRSMSVSGNTLLTLDSVGMGSMYSLTDPNGSLLSSIDVGGSSPIPGWSTHLSLHSSSGFAVFGTSSATPLVTHGITESGINPQRQAILALSTSSSSTPRRAVYSITGTTPRTFPWASSSDQIVISGWFHGIITLHDLRCPTHGVFPGGGPSLLPVLTMQDTLTLSPIYSISSVGAHIAAGSARNSIVHLYDVRSPRMGWSIYLPQGQGRSSSPVYSCLLEGTRLWAATENRPFVVDFGKVNARTFPPVTERNKPPGSAGGLGWYAPVCEHSMFKFGTHV